MDNTVKFVKDPETNIKFLNPNCISIRDADDDGHPDIEKQEKLNVNDSDIDAKLEANIDKVWEMHPPFLQTPECVACVKDIPFEKYSCSSGDRVVECPICSLRMLSNAQSHFEKEHPFIFTKGCIFCKADLPHNLGNYKAHLEECHADEILRND